jgi:hypothetical protein
MKEDVTRRFDEELKKVFGPTQPEILKFLLTHERRDLCIRNICREISKANGLALRVSLTNYDKLIRDLARFFAKTAIQHIEEQLLSHGEKVRRVSAADHLKRAEEMLVDLEKEAMKNATDDEKAEWLKTQKQRASKQI